MARGKQTHPKLKEMILMEYATNNNMNETARIFGVGVATVKRIIDEDRQKLEEYRKQKHKELIDEATEWKKQFLKRAEEAIEKATKLAIDKITNDPENINLKELSTFIGTLYDKRALESGQATSRSDNMNRHTGNLNVNMDVDLTNMTDEEIEKKIKELLEE